MLLIERKILWKNIVAKFITICGKKQTGKDTSASYIKNILMECGYDGRRIHITHFADALKQATFAIFGIPTSDFETDVGKNSKTDVRWPKEVDASIVDGINDYQISTYEPDNNGEYMTVREILQFVGTELIRNQMDPDTWVKSVFRQQWRDDDVVIIADCRFPNEAEFARERGLLLKVERNVDFGDHHVSEMALDDYNNYHYILQNNGSFNDLRKKLYVVLAEKDFITP